MPQWGIVNRTRLVGLLPFSSFCFPGDCSQVTGGSGSTPPPWKTYDKSMISPLEIVMWPHFITKLTSERILLQPQGSVTFIGGSTFWIKSWDMWNIYIYVMNLWGSLPSNMGLWWLNYLHQQSWGWSQAPRIRPSVQVGLLLLPTEGLGLRLLSQLRSTCPCLSRDELGEVGPMDWVLGGAIYIYIYIYNITIQYNHNNGWIYGIIAP